MNYSGVDASRPLSVWRKKGWIQRWKAIRRHVRQIERHGEPGDAACRRRQRQALLHWAYDSRKI